MKCQINNKALDFIKKNNYDFLSDIIEKGMIKISRIIFSSKVITIFLVVLLLFSLISSFYLYRQNQKQKEIISKTKKLAAPAELQKIIDRVGKLMELPKGETPSLATVSDKTALKKQNFFTNAENGDRVLIYSNAKRAILYRESINKIIDVAPINIVPAKGANVAGVRSDDSAVKFIKAPTPSLSQSLTVTLQPDKIMKLAIYNGTKISGLTSLTEKQVTQKLPEIEVVQKADAIGNYNETLIIDLKGNNQIEAEKIAKLVSGKVTLFPKNESTPEADILVIIGQ